MPKPFGIIGLENAIRKSRQMTDAVFAEQRKATTKILLRIEKDAKINAHKVFSDRGKRKGDFASSISHRVTSPDSGEVGVFGTAGGYAAFVEYGTGMLGGQSPAHYDGIPDFPPNYKPSGKPIKPIHGGTYLRWEDPQHKGEFIYVKQTKGMPPYPFLRPAVHKNMKAISDDVKEHFNALMKGFEVR